MSNFSKSTTWVLLIFALISIVTFNANAQSPMAAPGPGTAAMAPTPDCTTQLYNMSDCLTYASEGSNLTKPDKACCPELAGMLDSNPICLCQLLGKTSDFSVDLKRALKLPSACGLKAPDVSLCAAVGFPVGAPAGAPTSSEGPSSSSAAMSPEAGEAVAGKNGASSAHFSVAYLVAGFAVAFTLLKL